MPDSSFDQADREALVGQFAYLADELDAQLAVFGIVPDGLVDLVPPGSDRSLRGMYEHLAVDRARSDRDRLTPWLSADPPPMTARAGTPLAALIGQAAEDRRQLASVVESIPPDAWSRSPTGEPLPQVVMAFVQDDTETLRAIAERLFDGGLRGPALSV